jgi:cytochrome c553
MESSFANYLSGDRPQDKKMKEKMAALSESDIKALINYYASQQ